MSRVQRSMDVHIPTLYCSMMRNMASDVEEPCARSLVEEKKSARTRLITFVEAAEAHTRVNSRLNVSPFDHVMKRWCC